MSSYRKNRLAKNYDVDDDDLDDYYSDRKSKRSHKSHKSSKRDYKDDDSDEYRRISKKKSKKSKKQRESSSDNNSSSSERYSKRSSKVKKSKKSKKYKKDKNSDSEESDKSDRDRLRNTYIPPEPKEEENEEEKEEDEDKKSEKEKEEMQLLNEVYEFNKNIIRIIATPLNYEQPQTMQNANKISGFGTSNKDDEKKGVKQKFYSFLSKLGEQCCDFTLQRQMAECVYCFEKQKIYKSEKYNFQCINCMGIQGGPAKQKIMPKVVYQKMHCGFCKKVFKYKPGYSVYIDCTLCLKQNYYPLEMQPKQPALVQQQREYHKSMIQHQIENQEKEKQEKEKKKEKNKLKEKQQQPLQKKSNLTKKEKNSDDEDFYSD